MASCAAVSGFRFRGYEERSAAVWSSFLEDVIASTDQNSAEAGHIRLGSLPSVAVYSVGIIRTL